MGEWKIDPRLCWATGLCLFIVLLLALRTFTVSWPAMKAEGFDWVRQFNRREAERDTRHWHVLEGRHVTFRYCDDDAGLAPAVLRDTERIYPQVTKLVGFDPAIKPLVLLYPDRESFNGVFGWKDQSAMGVYYAGVVRVLSPRVWSRDDADMAGPMAHELAHLVLDYQTGGNIPRWFTEGVAQEAERRLSGVSLSQPKGDWASRLYPFAAMDGDFDSLEDQRMAYRQSLLAVEVIGDAGPEALTRTIDGLSEGKTVAESITAATGWTWERFVEKVHAAADKESRSNR
ncbi:hypothetical protein GTO89_14345 [Heliobacterium gestii]|uniref:Peptidase MA-like domain-containing protein n=1 Tax=Heliomicrobium gestii TaxID=2699 RepID=A0A845LLF2_HELGE|nr:hypothetical protein [Heliomicrobium gestii]MBM7867821.1 hypothetical protein [Heliomicrobium gestii]MZP44213.1 hypothetical protein [Heliomicrobium gestii]